MRKILVDAVKRHKMSCIDTLIGLVFGMIAAMYTVYDQPKWYIFLSLVAAFYWFLIAWSETIFEV